MLKPVIMAWNARQLSKAMDKGEAVFDNAVQRRLVWNNDRKSLLIHSMIYGYPVPQMYAVKENKSFVSFMDGKQRSNAIHGFFNDEYELTNVPEVTLENGTEIDINGMKFSDLPEEIKDILSNYSLHIEYYDNITDDEVCELFFRLNNGVAPTNIEVARSRAVSLKEIQNLGKHELFTSSLSSTAFEKYTHEDLVVKSYIMLTQNNPCCESKLVRQIMETTEFTDDVIAELTSIYDRILAVYKLIVADTSKETGKLSKKIAKRVITRTHMLSIIPIVKKSIDDGVSIEMFAGWIKNFYCGAKSATKYDRYNNNATSGSGRADAIKSRLDVIKTDYNKFMKEHTEDEFKVEIVEEVEVVETAEETVETVEETEVKVEETTEEVVDAEVIEVEEATEVIGTIPEDFNSDVMVDDFSTVTETTEVEEIDILGITDEDDIPDNVRAILKSAENEEIEEDLSEAV